MLQAQSNVIFIIILFQVTACARGLYDVTFIPQTVEPHFVNITFNDISIDGNPFKVSVHLMKAREKK